MRVKTFDLSQPDDILCLIHKGISGIVNQAGFFDKVID